MRLITPFTIFRYLLKLCMVLSIIYIIMYKFGVDAVRWQLIELFIPECFYSWVAVVLLGVGVIS